MHINPGSNVVELQLHFYSLATFLAVAMGPALDFYGFLPGLCSDLRVVTRVHEGRVKDIGVDTFV